jgi:hypothetical protein
VPRRLVGHSYLIKLRDIFSRLVVAVELVPSSQLLELKINNRFFSAHSLKKKEKEKIEDVLIGIIYYDRRKFEYNHTRYLMLGMSSTFHNSLYVVKFCASSMLGSKYVRNENVMTLVYYY